jgi:hypothetical protein
MPWYVLLIVALASLAIVIGFVAWLALKGWRLAKHGMAVSRRITPLADGLTRRADEISAAAERLSSDGESLTESLAKLQVSLARLQVVSATIGEAMEPFLLLTGWLAGDRGYNDWRRWSREHPQP